MSAANFHAARVHHRIRRVKLAVRVFVGFLDSPYRLHRVQGSNQLRVHPGGVAYQTHDGGIFTLGHVDAQTHGLKILLQLGYLILLGTVLQNNDHGISSILPC